MYCLFDKWMLHSFSGYTWTTGTTRRQRQRSMYLNSVNDGQQVYTFLNVWHRHPIEPMKWPIHTLSVHASFIIYSLLLKLMKIIAFQLPTRVSANLLTITTNSWILVPCKIWLLSVLCINQVIWSHAQTNRILFISPTGSDWSCWTSRVSRTARA